MEISEKSFKVNTMQKKIDKMKQGFETAFINQNKISNLAYKPQFVSNNYDERRKVLSSIEDELRNCDNFFICVAFITMSGLTPLLQTLKDLEIKGISGQILTTDYLSFSEPKAIRKLAELKNIKLKMYCTKEAGEGFHTKGYIFKQDEIYRIIVGSSNITLGALTKNKEWNTRIISTEQGEYANEIVREFNELWNSRFSKDYNDFIEQYSVSYDLIKKQKELAKKAEVSSIDQYKLQPNEMQVAFVSSVRKIQEEGKDKALLISSTGERVIIVTSRKSPVIDANYNLSLHREVLRLLGVKMDIEEMMDDYQKIYEEKMIGEMEERNGKDKKIDRGRGR